MEEIWKDIVGFERMYQVSNLGRVKSMGKIIYKSNGVRQTFSERILKPGRGSHGYYGVALYNKGMGETHLIHRLIADAFIPNPDNKPMINHIDSDKTNNSISNLEWVNGKENSNHASVRGRMRRNHNQRINYRLSKIGELNPMSKLSNADVKNIKRLIPFMKQKDIANIYNINATVISNIKNNKRWNSCPLFTAR